MSARLFTPIKLGDVTFDNRIVVAPMCQYSAVDGCMTDWHMMHLGSLANSGAGLLIVEATAVEAAGRITLGCTGLFDDASEAAMKPVVDACRRYGTAKLGMQLGHAGRKASSTRPWEQATHGEPIKTHEAWQTKAPSAVPLAEHWHVPAAYSEAEIEALPGLFAAAAVRADRLGFDLVEAHAAHGYLLHQFLSPLSNKRNDAWGGPLENRMRAPLAVFEAIRRVWPAGKPAGVRVSATDWVEGGWTLEDTIVFARRLKELGCDFIDASSGGSSLAQKITIGPGYQVPFAEAIKREVGLPTMAVGMITEAEQAEAILAEDKADMIAIARGFLDDPRWGWHAAIKLGAEIQLAPQYRRVLPKAWDPARRHATARA